MVMILVEFRNIHIKEVAKGGKIAQKKPRKL
jgi:hypothetical protein